MMSIAVVTSNHPSLYTDDLIVYFFNFEWSYYYFGLIAINLCFNNKMMTF